MTHPSSPSAAALHSLEMFDVDPFFAHIDFAPTVWESLFLPHMASPTDFGYPSTEPCPADGGREKGKGGVGTELGEVELELAYLEGENVGEGGGGAEGGEDGEFEEGAEEHRRERRWQSTSGREERMEER